MKQQLKNAATAIALAAVLAVANAHAEPLDRRNSTTIHEDQFGRDIGRADRRGNITIHHDSSGRELGGSERRPDGTTIRYDQSGRSVGSSREQRR
jgi:hypothetical protein